MNIGRFLPLSAGSWNFTITRRFFIETFYPIYRADWGLTELTAMDGIDRILLGVVAREKISPSWRIAQEL